MVSGGGRDFGGNLARDTLDGNSGVIEDDGPPGVCEKGRNIEG